MAPIGVGAGLLLAIVIMCNSAQAADSWKKISCREWSDYLNFDNGTDISFALEDEVKEVVLAKYPGGDFNVECRSSEIQIVDSKTAKFRMKFLAVCISTPIEQYVCYDINNKRIGNIEASADIVATCPGGVDKKKNCSGKLSNIKITKGPLKPSPSPQNVWLDTNYEFVPEKVRAAVKAQAKKVSVLSRSGFPYRDGDDAAVLYQFDIRRKEDSKGITYEMPVVVFTKSLAKKCPYPFLYQDLVVQVRQTKDGKVSSPGYKLKKVVKADGLDPEAEADDSCIGKADWKAGVVKADKFLKTVKPSEGGK